MYNNRKYTEKTLKCENCYKTNNFLISVVTKDKKHYFLTQCPHCKSHDEVKEITKTEYDWYSA
jgi:Zn finger protein HypA/HybF involved in hydrogenase expression